MADLTDEELAEWGAMGSARDIMGMNRHRVLPALKRAIEELQRHRAARTADEERVRSVVRDAVEAGYEFAVDNADISEHDGWHRTDPRIEWPTESKREVELDAIATRAAKQLATPVARMSDEDIGRLEVLVGSRNCTSAEQADLLRRIIASHRSTP
jgi:hypothetical protein